MKRIQTILSVFILSVFFIPSFSFAEVLTGVVVTDVTYTADAHTAVFTLVYTYTTAGVEAPEGFTLEIVGVTDPAFTYNSLPFGPASEEPGLDTRSATFTVTGLEPDSVYSYKVLASGIEMDAYWSDSFKTGVSDGEYISGDAVPKLGEPGDDAYYFLAPLPLTGVQIDKDGNQFINIGSTDGSTGPNFDFGDYVNGLLTFAIGIAGALAVVMIVVGGVQYMSTDNFGEKAQGKEHIKNSLGGLILLIGSYMILNTLNPDLVNFRFEVPTVSIEADPIFVLEHSDENSAPVGGKECGGKYTVNQTWFSDAPVRAAAPFSPETISINKINCTVVNDATDPGGKNCTSVYELKLDGINKIKEKCPDCEIEVTGGTECWLHSYTTAHGPGNEVVDLHPTASLTNYIHGEGNINSKGPIKGWGDLYVVDNMEFVYELTGGAHYHMVSSSGQGKASGKLKY